LSKFRGVLDAARGREREEAAVPAAARKRARKKAPAATASKRGRGRPPGKRSDPDYEQVTSYVRRQTYADVKIELIREGKKREFSELVEELLAQWLKTRR
jgi:hypothetical protein